MVGVAAQAHLGADVHNYKMQRCTRTGGGGGRGGVKDRFGNHRPAFNHRKINVTHPVCSVLLFVDLMTSKHFLIN